MKRQQLALAVTIATPALTSGYLKAESTKVAALKADLTKAVVLVDSASQSRFEERLLALTLLQKLSVAGDRLNAPTVAKVQPHPDQQTSTEITCPPASCQMPCNVPAMPPWAIGLLGVGLVVAARKHIG